MSRYCHRCDRYFVHNNALQQHLRDSPRHYICKDDEWGYCGLDADDWDELKDHCIDEQHGWVCNGCENISWSREAYLGHLEERNSCETCDKHFDTVNNLMMHQLTHRQADIECIICGDDRLFTTYSGMIIHLEAGNCSTAVDLAELNCAAAKCYGSSAFVNKEQRRQLINRDTSYLREGQDRPFKCPTCESSFTKLSGLFQHIESSACSQTLTKGAIGTLRKWLKKTSIRIHNEASRDSSESVSDSGDDYWY